MPEKIVHGAEAIISKEDESVVKERIRKGYRLPEIDEKLRRKRTRSEASLLRAARRAGVKVPGVLDESDFSLRLEFIEGEKVKEALSKENAQAIGKKIADAIAKLHSYDIIHGDLTTSNMILHDNDAFFIDFGLGFQSQRIEDKAVDLYVLHEALESTHHDIKDELWKTILEAYSKHFSDAKKVIKALHAIEKRGRYRERIG